MKIPKDHITQREAAKLVGVASTSINNAAHDGRLNRYLHDIYPYTFVSRKEVLARTWQAGRGGIPHSLPPKNCTVCGKPVHNKKNVTCSANCAGFLMSQRRKGHPLALETTGRFKTRKELEDRVKKLYGEKVPFVRIATDCGICCDTAKRILGYEIPRHKK